MSRPEICLYCDGHGNGPGAPCGFCVDGVPLDTQQDWDRSWGRLEALFLANRQLVDRVQENLADPSRLKKRARRAV